MAAWLNTPTGPFSNVQKTTIGCLLLIRLTPLTHGASVCLVVTFAMTIRLTVRSMSDLYEVNSD